MKSYMAKPSTIEHKWFVVDAEGKTLGRLAVEVAKVLRGKNKPNFTPHMDTGDFVVVVNADKVHLTGNKLVQKTYFRHSGYVGGTTFTLAKDMLEKHPERMLELAIRGMLPKNRLGRAIGKKLKVYRGSEHPHAAQMPEKLELNIR